MKPVPKVAAAGIGGAVATIVVYIASQVGVEIPGDVGAALATVVAFAAAYLKP
jgi:putative flippase GtrA